MFQTAGRETRFSPGKVSYQIARSRRDFSNPSTLQCLAGEIDRPSSHLQNYHGEITIRARIVSKKNFTVNFELTILVNLIIIRRTLRLMLLLDSRRRERLKSSVTEAWIWMLSSICRPISLLISS